MEKIAHYCQKCSSPNEPGEQSCTRCGAPLMLIVMPRSQQREPPPLAPTFYEDHLLERVSLLELRVAQLAEQLSSAVDLIKTEFDARSSEKKPYQMLSSSIQKGGRSSQNEPSDLSTTGNSQHLRVVSSPGLDEILFAHSGSGLVMLERLCSDALVALAAGDEKRGIKAFYKALEISPDNRALATRFARHLFECERFDDAENVLKLALSTNAVNFDAQVLLGALFVDTRRSPEELLSPGGDISQRISTARSVILAIYAAFCEDYSQAEKYLKIDSGREESPEINYLLGCIYAARGEDASAIDLFTKAVAADLRFADAWFMLSLIYERLNNALSANETRAAAFDSREPGAQCIKFLNLKNNAVPKLPLPFLHFADSKSRILFGGSSRLRRYLFDRIVFV